MISSMQVTVIFHCYLPVFFVYVSDRFCACQSVIPTCGDVDYPLAEREHVLQAVPCKPQHVIVSVLELS